MFGRYNRLLPFALAASSRHLFIVSKAFQVSSSTGATHPSKSLLLHRRNYAVRAKSFLAGAVVSISDAFDGGNIKFIETKENEGDNESATKIILQIKPDPYTELEKANHFQYFSFRSTVNNAMSDNDNSEEKSIVIEYVIENAGNASYAIAWKDSTVCYSTTNHNDPESWKRKVDTKYDEQTGQLTWTHVHHVDECSSSSVYFAYFPPYTYERHLNLISNCVNSIAAKEKKSGGVRVEILGQSLDGRDIECVIAGKGPKKCWIIHRQHPGESMAEYYAEGLLHRLLGIHSGGSIDGATRRVLEEYTFYIAPNMCIDGSVKGHLRTNSIGTNLNREWAPSIDIDGNEYNAPTVERSPEVYYVLKKMDETNVDVFLDVHGDEELPYNFFAGGEGCPNWSLRLQNLHGAFLASYCRSNSDMNQIYGYEPDEPMKGKLNICSNQIGSRFNCLSATLEMPFKDCLSNPDPTRGWSPSRAKMLGASVVDALLYISPYLRDEGEFWKDLPKSDAYIRPTSKYRKTIEEE